MPKGVKNPNIHARTCMKTEGIYFGTKNVLGGKRYSCLIYSQILQ